MYAIAKSQALADFAKAVQCLDGVPWAFDDALDAESIEDGWHGYTQPDQSADARDPIGLTHRQFQRNVVVANHPQEWSVVPTASLHLVHTLYAVGELDLLGNRAGLKLCRKHAGPSCWCRHEPALIPSPPPTSIDELAELVGGVHRLRARMLWWCAAAETPADFGYPNRHRQAVLFGLPFWTRVERGRGLADRTLLNLMSQEAKLLLQLVERRSAARWPQSKRSSGDNMILLEALLLKYHGGDAARDHVPLTQEEMAKELGLSQPTVSRTIAAVFPDGGMKAYQTRCRSGRVLAYLARRRYGSREVDAAT